MITRRLIAAHLAQKPTLSWRCWMGTSAPISREAINRKKHPNRGGRNLTDRYHQLERSLRGREALAKEFDVLAEQTSPAVLSLDLKPSMETFRGFQVPQKPEPPADDECCMSGCAICVYDLYEDSLAAYEDSVHELRKLLEGKEIPQSEWPVSIRPTETATAEPAKRKIHNAFEELERALLAKKHNTSPSDVAS